MLKEDEVVVLRTCNSDMTSYGGFFWPESGEVVALDWDPDPVCGKGLHGFLRGEGDGALANWSECAKWIVLAVNVTDVVELD